MMKGCTVKTSEMDGLGNVSWIEIRCPITKKMREEMGYRESSKTLIWKIKPQSSIEIIEKDR